jgi:hypothetical protein
MTAYTLCNTAWNDVYKRIWRVVCSASYSYKWKEVQSCMIMFLFSEGIMSRQVYTVHWRSFGLHLLTLRNALLRYCACCVRNVCCFHPTVQSISVLAYHHSSLLYLVLFGNFAELFKLVRLLSGFYAFNTIQHSVTIYWKIFKQTLALRSCCHSL